MVLAYHARQSTKDVDAIFAPAGVIRDLAAEIGHERGLDADWINDGVKGFVSSRAAFAPLELDLSNLSVLMPVPEYLLAMKCMSARTGESSRDMEDVKFLIRHLARSVLSSGSGVGENAVFCGSRVRGTRHGTPTRDGVSSCCRKSLARKMYITPSSLSQLSE